MPIISLEPFLFPEELFEAKDCSFGLNRLPDCDARWWVLRTRPRCEKALARSLFDQGISFFLPLFERRHRMQGRRVVSHLPLFSGYVFLHGTTEARLAALKTNRVLHSLFVTDDEQSQLYADLRRFFLLMECGAPLSPESRLAPGTLAEVTDGPFAGFRGTVLRCARSTRLVVALHFLQQGASVEVDASHVQSLGETRFAGGTN